MNLLAFDTSCDACSVAVWHDHAVTAHEMKPMKRGQSEELVPMIDRVMHQAGKTFSELSAVAVTAGPGAFTGLRIALATARAIAMAIGRPAVGVSTFEAVAAAAARDDQTNAPALVVAIDTKRDDLYVQSFRRDASALGFSPVDDGAVLMPSAALATLPSGALLLAGDGASHLRRALGDEAARVVLSHATVPDARDVAAIAMARLASGMTPPPLHPMYLRPPAVRMPSAVALPETP